MLDISERKHFGLALSFATFLRATLEKIKKCKQQLKAYQIETGVNMKELRRQAESMHKYIQEREENTVDIDNDICETIMAMQVMEEFEAAYRGLSNSSQTSMAYLNLRMNIHMRTGGRIDCSLENTYETLRKRFNELLRKAQQSRSLWFNEDNSTTDHYKNVLEHLPFAELRRLRHEIWITLLCRNQEYHDLKASSLMGNSIFTYY
jgi:hypothetical protein